jgi:hypothetical protein
VKVLALRAVKGKEERVKRKSKKRCGLALPLYSLPFTGGAAAGFTLFTGVAAAGFTPAE